ncbi:MAG: hypothetical protein JRN52_04465 [Nitrososphaerota archaeon]|nr:hypothetical protein [Nitrososphaerota archaeon]
MQILDGLQRPKMTYQLVETGNESQWEGSVMDNSEITERKQGRRSRMETYFDVLTAVGSGAEKPTRIMYKSNICWTVLKESLARLQNCGLIAEEVDRSGRRSLRLTSKGFGLVKDFLSMKEDLGITGSEF